MNKPLSLDLQMLSSIIEDDMKTIRRRLASAIESLLKQIEPDEKNSDGSFVLYFDDVNEQVFWNSSSSDTDTSELRSITVRFEHTAMVLDFGFVGDDDFDVDMDDLRIETMADMAQALLNRLNAQRLAKPKATKKKK